MNAPLWGEVVEVRRVTPRLVAVELGGEGLDAYRSTEHTDQYVNALFAPAGAALDVPFDLDEARARPSGVRPVGRRYTVRRWDAERRRVTFELVVHGDVGNAGRWADRAGPGDRLQFVGPSGGYRPDPAAEAHLMVGDESALPAIAASLEVVPEGRPVVVVAIVDDADHELDLPSPGAVDLVWLHRRSAGTGPDPVVAAVAALDLPSASPQLFVHGEASEVRAVRRHLLGDRALAREGASISPYWRRDRTDEEWRAEKSQWLAEVAEDV